MFLAKSLSDNTFDFGLSARDFFVIGILGMASSLIAMFRPCVVMCSVCRRHDYSKDFKDTVIQPSRRHYTSDPSSSAMQIQEGRQRNSRSRAK